MTKHDPLFSIQVTDLSKRFNREWIFRNFTYQFTSGNTFAITGPNGSGKSTLLQVLWGQVPQTSGQLRYSKGTAEIPVEDVCHRLTIATPYMDLIDEFTLTEQLEFHFKLKKARGGKSIAELLEILYLEDARNKFIGNFSSGMKQRVKLGLAFYTEADMVFLDEPGSHLDDKAFAWYLSEYAKMPSGTLVFIGSNDEAEYPGGATRINLPDLKK
jgi:ABC-type multidrug transport system ATPase subunit